MLKQLWAAVRVSPAALIFGAILLGPNVPGAASDPTVRMDWPTGERRAWPVTAGVPFAQGALVDPATIELLGADGRSTPVQKRVLQKWHRDGSVRWLSLDFDAEPGHDVYRVATDGRPTPDHPREIELTEEEDEIVISTGHLRVSIPRQGSGGMFGEVWSRGKLVCDRGRGGYLVDQNGVEFAATDKDGRVSVERRGPVHTVVRVDGSYASRAGETKCAYTARLHFYAGKPFVRVQHTFLFTEDSDDLQLQDLGIRTRLASSGGSRSATFPLGVEPDAEVHTVGLRGGADSVSLRQDVYHHLGQPESRWVLCKTEGGTHHLFDGERAGNWVTLRAGDVGMTVVMRNFWQEFPKALEVRGSSVVAHLWSGKAGRMLDFRMPAFREFWGGDRLKDLWRRSANSFCIKKILDGTYPSNAKGLAKTHDLLYYFHDADTDARAVAQVFTDPPLAYPDPAYTASTDAVGLLSPRDPDRFPEEEAALDTHVETAQRLVREWGTYGWWEHGAGPHMTYELDKDGRPTPLPWRYTGGVEYWFTRALWLGYLRSGDRRYFELASGRSRHFMDVVISHMDTDTRWKGCFFWTAAGPPVHWGGSNPNPWSEIPEGDVARSPRGYHLHQFGWTVDSLLHYYYLTGDERAWDVVMEYADFQKRRLDYEGWVDDALSPAATNIMKSRMIFATLDELSILYEATGDETFRRLAGQLAARILLPDEPGGIHREPWPPGSGTLHPRPYALYYKTPCVVRYWRATGDPLARDTVLRMAKYDFEGEHWGPFAAGLRYAYAWKFGALEAYLGCGRHAAWRSWRRSAMAAADTPYRMATKAFTLNTASHVLSLNALMAIERRLGRPIPPFPVLSRGTESPRCELLVKTIADDARVGVRTGPHPLAISPAVANVTTTNYFPEGLPSGQYRNDCAYHDVVLPGGKAGRVYRIDAPARSEVHVLTAKGVKVMLHAPQGFPIEAEQMSAKWFFRVPKNQSSFVVECADPQLISVVSPTGRVATPKTERAFTLHVDVGPDERAGSWALAAANSTFVKVSGVRPVFAYRDAGQLFDARDEVDIVAPPGKEERRDRFVEGVSGLGLKLTAAEYLSVRLGEALAPQTRERLDMLEGTLEFWARADWPYFFVPGRGQRILCSVSGARRGRAVLSAGYLKQIRSRGTIYDIRAVLYGTDARIGNTQRRKTWWMPGEWFHFAIEWGREGNGPFTLRPYYNGKPGGNKGQEQAWSRLKAFEPLPIGDRLSILGGPGGSPFGATIDELRISRTRRYRNQPFTPGRELAADRDTLLHLRFEGDLEAEPKGDGVPGVTKIAEITGVGAKR